jgi:hypothetical protein
MIGHHAMIGVRHMRTHIVMYGNGRIHAHWHTCQAGARPRLLGAARVSSVSMIGAPSFGAKATEGSHARAARTDFLEIRPHRRVGAPGLPAFRGLGDAPVVTAAIRAARSAENSAPDLLKDPLPSPRKSASVPRRLLHLAPSLPRRSTES